MAGCGIEEDEPVQPPWLEIPASEESTQATGVHQWNVSRYDDEFGIVGVDENGEQVAEVVARVARLDDTGEQVTELESISPAPGILLAQQDGSYLQVEDTLAEEAEQILYSVNDDVLPTFTDEPVVKADGTGSEDAEDYDGMLGDDGELDTAKADSAGKALTKASDPSYTKCRYHYVCKGDGKCNKKEKIQVRFCKKGNKCKEAVLSVKQGKKVQSAWKEARDSKCHVSHKGYSKKYTDYKSGGGGGGDKKKKSGDKKSSSGGDKKSSGGGGKKKTSKTMKVCSKSKVAKKGGHCKAHKSGSVWYCSCTP